MDRVEKMERELSKWYKLRPIFEHYTMCPPKLTKTFRFLYRKIIWTDPILVIREYLPDSYYYYALRIIKLFFKRILILEISWETTRGSYLFHHIFYILTPKF